MGLVGLNFTIFSPHRMHLVYKMRPTATYGVAWSVGLSVCVCVGHVREPAETAEPIEMPLGN